MTAAEIFFHLAEQDRGNLRHFADRRPDLKQHDARGGGIDQVEHIVERHRQVVDVFTVDGRDESLVQLADHGMRQIIPEVFEIFDPARQRLQFALRFRDHLVQHLRGFQNVNGHLVENAVELLVLLEESGHAFTQRECEFWLRSRNP